MSRGRRPATVPTVPWKDYIPVDVASEVELLLLDPTRERVKYGARSELITTLLRQYIAKVKGNAARQMGGATDLNRLFARIRFEIHNDPGNALGRIETLMQEFEDLHAKGLATT